MSVVPNVTGTVFNRDDETKFTNQAFGIESTNQVKSSWYEIYPGYATSRTRVLDAQMLLGMKWTDFRKMFVDFFHKVFGSARTRRFIKLIMMRTAGKFIPVRTGHLYDAIFRSLIFYEYHTGNAVHIMVSEFRWPWDRPYPIHGTTAHSFPSVGYGDPRGVIDMPIKYQAPNINFIGIGPKGGLLFGLNDPLAVNDPVTPIQEASITQMQAMFRDVYKGLIVKYVHRNVNPTVVVGGGGSQITMIDSNGNKSTW